ncbi:MAG: hypothetical protein QOD09_5084 [Bradyrhizobium sp.]|jgi:hypothetical protein|nr:hypothetical protein [Bradyrhizobium sp.]
MSDPILNFVGILAHQVNATFANFPEGSRIVVVSQTTGETMPDLVTKASGSGPVGINLPDDFPAGDFYLKGLDADGGYLAQSVGFHF